MIVTDPRSLGLLVRQRRREMGWSQSRLAEAAEVSRPWISELEGGKSTAELGLVFSVLQALGLRLSAAGTGDKPPAVKSGEPIRNTVRGRPAITKAGKSIAVARARSSFSFPAWDKPPAKTRSE